MVCGGLCLREMGWNWEGVMDRCDQRYCFLPV